MSETTHPAGGLTRRGFLKGAGAAAGALGLAGVAGMTATDGWFAPAKAVAEPEERIAYTYHLDACNGKCSLKCTVRDDRLVKIEPNDALEEPYCRCCAKGISEIQHIYGATRLQTPLKLVGARGSGEYVAISWDEALSIIGERLGEIRTEFGTESVHVSCSGAPEFPFLSDILCATTSGLGDGLDMGTANGFDPAFGGGVWCGATNESRDWVNARLLLMLGTNYLESSMMQAAALFDAQEAGCEVIVVDPRFSTTASKADRWMAIEPGTDAALLLGMISHILDNGYYDEDFIVRNTSLPFLVSEEDGALIRQFPVAEEERFEDMGDNGNLIWRSSGSEPGAAADNPFLIWDISKAAAVPFNEERATPALMGEFEIEGKRCKPVFQLLIEQQAAYSCAWAAEVCGIPADDIEWLAERYATAGSASLAVGYGGGDKYSNADVAGHAVVLLAALTGNIGAPGRSVGYFGGGAGHGVGFGSWPLPEEYATVPRDMWTFEYRKNPGKVRALISIGNTLQTYFSNMNLTREWLADIDFILGIEVYNSDSAVWADIVLPACTKFECSEEIGGITQGYNHIRLRERVIEPLFESKNDFEIERLIAESLGLADALPKSQREYVECCLAGAEEEWLASTSVEDLLANQGVMKIEGSDEPVVGYVEQAYDTPSGRLELYYADMLPYGQALPAWEENHEVGDGNPLREKYPFQLMQARTKMHVHSQFCDATWIRQFCGTYLELNPQDLTSLGLCDGDIVKVSNDRGAFECAAAANESVRPGSAFIYEGSWSRDMVSGNIQDVTSDCINERGRVFPLGPVLPFNDTLVAIEKA